MGAGNRAGDAVACCAETWLSGGPMSRTRRASDYRAFLAGAFPVDTPAEPVFGSGGTHCAIFARACLTLAGVKPPGRRPKRTAITTWLGVDGFVGETSWRSLSDLEAHGGLLRGDVLYWANREDGKDGHVGICLTGEGWLWRTAEGGGGDGSVARMSAEPKDVRSSRGRRLRGVWRPGAMPELDTSPAPKARVLRLTSPRMTGLDVETLQTMLGKIPADGVFGPQTEARVREVQVVLGIVADGIVGPVTWKKLESRL